MSKQLNVPAELYKRQASPLVLRTAFVEEKREEISPAELRRRWMVRKFEAEKAAWWEDGGKGPKPQLRWNRDHVGVRCCDGSYLEVEITEDEGDLPHDLAKRYHISKFLIGITGGASPAVVARVRRRR